MKVTIAKRFTFDAAHRLDQLPTTHKCHRLHGHTYQVEIVLESELDQRGFVVDYDEVAAAWRPLHLELDHRYLNDVVGLEVPSTENLAIWIWRRLRANAADPDSPLAVMATMLTSVRVSESSTTWAEVKR